MVDDLVGNRTVDDNGPLNLYGQQPVEFAFDAEGRSGPDVRTAMENSDDGEEVSNLDAFIDLPTMHRGHLGTSLGTIAVWLRGLAVASSHELNARR